MPTLKVEGAIVDNGRILLVEDDLLPGWRMPGGHVHDGVSLTDALMDLVKAQTGFEIRVGRLIGVYGRPSWRRGGDITCVLTALPLTRRPVETGTHEFGYYLPQGLPANLFPCQAQRIEDMYSGQQRSFVRDQEMIWPFETDEVDQVLISLASQDYPDRQSAMQEAVRRLGLAVSEAELASWLAEE